MTLHPQAAALLDALREQGLPSAEQVSLTTGRQLMGKFVDLQGEQLDVQTRDITVRGAAGRLPARVYQPHPARTTGPLIVYFHGGGWISGDLEIVDRPLRRLADRTGAAIASVGYRMAPETPFPGPVEDAFAALADISGQAVAFGADPLRLFVAGDSAGGNIAAVTAIMARDRSGPPLAGQILLYPVTAPAPTSVSGSYQENGDGYLLTAAAMRFYWDHYVQDVNAASNPYAAPLLADDLGDLPEALVITAEFDPLRDEGEAYAQLLVDSGVVVSSVRIDGTIHGFFWLPGVLDSFDIAVNKIVEFLGHRDHRQTQRSAGQMSTP
jgi:acetyl esterase